MQAMTVPRISSQMAQTIRDAILLGGADEIDDILDRLKDEQGFPDSLRSSLEAMLYFRRYYGHGGELEPVDPEEKRRMTEMEILWGRELLDSLDCYPDLSEEKIA